MRKILVFLSVLCLVSMLAVSAGAVTGAKTVSSYTTVTADGSCQSTMTVTIHLDAPVEDLTFPLPGEAKNITVNGSRAGSFSQNGLRMVKLPRAVGKTAGDFTLTFTYSLPNLIVTNEAQQLELHLPILAGFAYPVQALEFNVTMPGPISVKPAFTSGYHQANIEKDIYCTVSGATITGVAQTELKDHETLTMMLTVSEEMFPQTHIVPPNYQVTNTLLTIAAVLALVYWGVFLRNLPDWPHRCPMPPEGCNAGQLRSVLHLQGGDLTMMVFDWARLGYLRINSDRSGRVMLIQQMRMGNERSTYEQQCFQQLFGKRESIDATGARYAQLCQLVRKRLPDLGAYINRGSGNLTLFRILSAAVGMFGGVYIGIGMSTGAALQWFLVFVMGALALLSSWHIQLWFIALIGWEKRKLWLVLGLCGGWIVLALLANSVGAGIGLAVGQLLAGILLAFGGRRTREGRQCMGEVLGLRRYLCSVSRAQLQQICQNNPEYFHALAPYALAFGVERRFAKRFGGIPIGECPYITGSAANMVYAPQWAEQMRAIVEAMNARKNTGFVDKLLRTVQVFFR